MAADAPALVMKKFSKWPTTAAPYRGILTAPLVLPRIIFDRTPLGSLNAWEDAPVLEMHGPLDSRLGVVLTALEQTRRPARWD